MGTYPCMTCGGVVAPKARRCPHCGRKKPAATMGRAVRGVIFLVFLVCLLVGVIASR